MLIRHDVNKSAIIWGLLMKIKGIVDVIFMLTKSP